MEQQVSPTHPLLACARSMDASLKDVIDVDPLFMATEDKAEALLEVSAVVERATELMLRLLGSADDVADAASLRDPAAYLAHQTRRDRSECRRLLRLARDLKKFDATGAAVREGSATVAQAAVITRTVRDLDDNIPGRVKARAEQALLDETQNLAPRELGYAGHRVLEFIAPTLAEAQERRRVAAENAAVDKRTSLTSRRNGDGTTDLRIRVADSVSARLMTYLQAFANPRRDADKPDQKPVGQDTAGGDRQPYDLKLGRAFAAFVENADPKRMPIHGGDATTVIVTIDLKDLMSGLGLAHLGDQPISAAEARRLACTANIIPAVLGGDSEVLDFGRARRLYSRSQRKAMGINQPTCRAEGCDIPSTWCEAHHGGLSWGEGGLTNLADGVLLCSFHHHRAHSPGYETVRRPTGRVAFVRRT